MEIWRISSPIYSINKKRKMVFSHPFYLFFPCFLHHSVLQENKYKRIKQDSFPSKLITFSFYFIQHNYILSSCSISHPSSSQQETNLSLDLNQIAGPSIAVLFWQIYSVLRSSFHSISLLDLHQFYEYLTTGKSTMKFLEEQPGQTI